MTLLKSSEHHIIFSVRSLADSAKPKSRGPVAAISVEAVRWIFT
jgi:hypothetical protein